MSQSQQPKAGNNAPMPAAPYPPFRNPAAGAQPLSSLKSSLSSSPHYTSTMAYVTRSSAASDSVGSTKTSMNSLQGSLPSGGEADHGDTMSTSTGMAMASRPFGGGATVTDLPKGVRGIPLYASQIKLYQSNVGATVAAINCAADSQHLMASAHRSANSSARKLGPVLLELRSLEPSTENEKTEFFETRICGVSRGNPSLGTSVTSTCLDLPAVQTYNHNSSNNSNINGRAFAGATGLTTGALCIHNFDGDTRDDSGVLSGSIEYYHMPRHHRQASAVAWRPSNANHVAIGLLGSSSGTGPQQANVGNRRGGAGIRASGDREFCCFLWDIETQSSSAAKRMATPVSKLSHNTPVASLAWLLEGQTLAVGCLARNIQLYDMRVSGTNAPPVSAYAHNFGVHGIEVDPHRPHAMATFCRSAGEPVKIWDIRRMDSVFSEIKPKPTSSESSDSSTMVSSIHWSVLEPGTLSVAMRSSVQEYETSSSRPVLCRVNHVKAGQQIVDIALYNGEKNLPPSALAPQGDLQNQSNKRLISGLYPRRMLTVLSDRTICDMARDTNAPMAISQRDGRLVHALGPTLWIGSTNEGPAAMEGLKMTHREDISATIFRRSLCLHVARYSMNTANNIKMLSEERPAGTPSPLMGSASNCRSSLLRLWSWIDRIESLCLDSEEVDEWPAKGLIDAGINNLLAMDKAVDEPSFSESLSIDTFSSPGRRSALTACGWAGKFDLTNVLAECEALGEYERSAAVAVWHGDIGAAVETLQRASERIRLLPKDQREGFDPSSAFATPEYAETLDLIAMCIAGYGGSLASTSSVWRNACSSLLRRDDLSLEMAKTNSRVAYLRSLCDFLLRIGLNSDMDHVVENEQLSLCDRLGFACRFFSQADLRTYLKKCMQSCQATGNLEGLFITGLSREGIAILQAYMDRYADVQTAALVVSRVILPSDWSMERRACTEWVEAYRGLLNTWQMWQSRAMFDVDRAELLRRVKIIAEVNPGGGGKGNFQARRLPHTGRRQNARMPDPDVLSSIPAQLDARCNYCSSPLGLRRNEMNANQWLSKMRPVLSCCPQCRKPLPRCSICLLSLGTLNPYMELTKDRARPGPRGISSSMQTTDDLGSLANLPFAEWFTWCMRCQHGGHAHHIVGWFAHNEVCPVSGCECRCQFDGTQKLNRPALSKNSQQATTLT